MINLFLTDLIDIVFSDIEILRLPLFTGHITSHKASYNDKKYVKTLNKTSYNVDNHVITYNKIVHVLLTTTIGSN